MLILRASPYLPVLQLLLAFNLAFLVYTLFLLFVLLQFPLGMYICSAS